MRQCIQYTYIARALTVRQNLKKSSLFKKKYNLEKSAIFKKKYNFVREKIFFF